MSIRHFLELWDWSREDLERLLKEAARLKKAQLRGKHKPLLQGRTLALIFEKPSLRTRVSFETAMAQLGGASVFLPGKETGLGGRESLPDFARTISQYVDAAVLRTFAHQTVLDFARHATCPVINGLTDYNHPCQALGDIMTIQEAFGAIEGKTVAFIGDGNNVARSVALACGKLGARFILSAPKGYTFDEPFLRAFRKNVPEGQLDELADPKQAVAEADVIYTDVWTSMGQEEETQARKKQFARYQVNADLVKLAPRHVRIMHCLPAHRGEEITEEVFESDKSLVFPQAGNRMHAQKALLMWVLRK